MVLIANKEQDCNTWINVNDNLPEIGKEVLAVVDKVEIVIAVYVGKKTTSVFDLFDYNDIDNIEDDELFFDQSVDGESELDDNGYPRYFDSEGTIFLKQGWYEIVKASPMTGGYLESTVTAWMPLPSLD